MGGLRPSFWRELHRTAWQNSKEHFQWKHPIGLACVGAVVQWYRVGLASAMGELGSIAASAGLAVAAYALIIYGVHLFKAPNEVYRALLKSIGSIERERDQCLKREVDAENSKIDRERRRDVVRRNEIKLGITTAIDAGRALRKIGDESAVVEWSNRIYAYITDAFGQAEAEWIARDDMARTAYASQYDGVVRLFIDRRLHRLDQFIERIMTLPVSEGFEPAKWALETSEARHFVKFQISPPEKRTVMMECLRADDHYAVGERAAWPPGMAQERLNAGSWKRMDDDAAKQIS